jgi:hypothetical protein
MSIEEHPSECPACGSTEVLNAYSGVEERYIHTYAELTREIRCDECGAGWTEVFAPAGYEDVVTNMYNETHRGAPLPKGGGA